MGKILGNRLRQADFAFTSYDRPRATTVKSQNDEEGEDGVASLPTGGGTRPGARDQG